MFQAYFLFINVTFTGIYKKKNKSNRIFEMFLIYISKKV